MLRGRIDTLLRPIDPLYKRFYPGRDLKSPVTPPTIFPPREIFGCSNMGVCIPSCDSLTMHSLASWDTRYVSRSVFLGLRRPHALRGWF